LLLEYEGIGQELTTSLRIESVSIRGIRNLRPLELTFSSTLNVVFGDNGQGKTSLLEALCIAAAGRSFRADQLREVVQTGAEGFRVSAELDDDGLRREQRVVFSGKTRRASIDGKPVASAAAYAIRTPVVVFYPNDLELVTGAAASRRTLLDRIALYTDPTTQQCRLAYARALRHRQRLLETAPVDPRALAAFEAILAEQGLHYAKAHTLAAENLRRYALCAFTELCPEPLELDVAFDGVPVPDVEAYRRELFERRQRDRQRGRATFGPHRDEVVLNLSGRSARHHASQGQQRLLALALKLAELKCVEVARRSHPILLLDDVASELDLARTASVFSWINGAPSQVFLSTPRPDLLRSLQLDTRCGKHFEVSAGSISESKSVEP